MVGYQKTGEHAVVIAGPNPVDRLVKGSMAFDDIEGGSMDATADQDVVDATAQLKRHLASPDERIAGCKCMARIGAVDGFPGVAICNAHPFEGLPAGPESQAGRVRRVVEVAEHDDMALRAVCEVVFDGARTRDRLQFALAAEADLVGRLVVHDDDIADWARQIHLHQECGRYGVPYTDDRIAQGAFVADLATAPRFDSPCPVLLMGDMNAAAASSVLRSVCDVLTDAWMAGGGDADAITLSSSHPSA
jgi:hypothetical protein